MCQAKIPEAVYLTRDCPAELQKLGEHSLSTFKLCIYNKTANREHVDAIESYCGTS